MAISKSRHLATIIGTDGLVKTNKTALSGLDGTLDSDDITEGVTNLYYTQARVDARVSTGITNLVDTAPATLDTLNELAAALGDDPNFATTVTTAIGTKLPLTGGTLTGALNVHGGRTKARANNETYSLQIEYGSGSGQYYIGATNSATPDLVFSNVGGAEKVRVTNDGNVGIGTSSPTSPLHVIGYIDASGLKDYIVTRLNGSTLIHGALNHLADSGTINLPAANSMANKQYIVVELPDYAKGYTPTIQCSGSDVIQSSVGQDTSIILDTGSSIRLTFRSNGSNLWYI